MDHISYKTLSANATNLSKAWLLVDAEGQSLGRLASQVAAIIRGKTSPQFSPHRDCGDNVIVINAEKIRLTGNKWEDKKYISHTGYPGGQKITTPRKVSEKSPTSIIERAVKGMLPKNRLGRQLFHNLFVYAGPDHKHEAQEPRKITLKG